MPSAASRFWSRATALLAAAISAWEALGAGVGGAWGAGVCGAVGLDVGLRVGAGAVAGAATGAMGLGSGGEKSPILPLRTRNFIPVFQTRTEIFLKP